MNRILCFLTGGHRYSDANTRMETAPDDFNTVILTNSCVKCGEPLVFFMNAKEHFENDAKGTCQLSRQVAKGGNRRWQN